MTSKSLRTLCKDSKFLIIDDFENFRTSLRLMLSSFGASAVEVAGNAEEALNKAKFESYDVILCDFNLGAGKNGQQILEELRLKKRLKRTHLFAMISADSSKEAVLGAREFQPDAYIAKPVTRSALEQRLGQLLSQQKSLKPINREIDLENFAKAISLCQKEIEQGSRYRSWCLQTMADLYRKMGDSSSAKKIYNEVLAQRPVDWARIGLAKTLYDASNYEEAKTVFSSVAGHSPFLVEAYEGISDSCARLGQLQEAQSALIKAVQVSPRMVKRQTKLAYLSIDNHDLHTASEAFRKAIEFGENTVHDTSSLYLSFGRCLSDLALEEDGAASEGLAHEANHHLDTVLSKFASEQEACLCAKLIKSRVYIGQGKYEEARALIDEARLDIRIENVSAELGIELSRSLYTAGEHHQAQTLLISLSERFENDPASLSMIEAAMDEPEPAKIRLKAQNLNRSGIELFEHGKLAEAIDAFSSAAAFTPKHAAVNLNLAQVALRLHHEEPDSDALSIVQTCVQRLEHLPRQHKQYKRLLHIKNALKQIQHGA